MAKFKVVVAYQGTEFCGWQRQKSKEKPSIQEEIEKALSEILTEKANIVGSGRTDSGVHALRQVFVFQTRVSRSPENIRRGLNGLLPENVRVLEVKKVPGRFHPQHDVKEKAYRYLIQNGPVSNPLLAPYTWFFPERLDVKKMRRAASYLEGRHNFAAFQDSGRKAKGLPNNSVRTVFHIKVERLPDSIFSTKGLIAVTIIANGFLYKMVRNIAGTLIEVGRGKMESMRVKEILKSGDRRLAGPTAPARGLTLLSIKY
ncbi:MAG: tRNA pseudouridine(38-40) synthase TruA [Candidatus Omnitrophota bacterium]